MALARSLFSAEIKEGEPLSVFLLGMNWSLKIPSGFETLLNGSACT
jgi:hypothetical protein